MRAGRRAAVTFDWLAAVGRAIRAVPLTPRADTPGKQRRDAWLTMRGYC